MIYFLSMNGVGILLDDRIAAPARADHLICATF